MKEFTNISPPSIAVVLAAVVTLLLGLQPSVAQVLTQFDGARLDSGVKLDIPFDDVAEIEFDAESDEWTEIDDGIASNGKETTFTDSSPGTLNAAAAW